MPSVIVLGAGPGGYAAAFYAADLGMQVTLVDEESEDEASYQIVGECEADVKKGKISVTSPIARAIIGKKKGDSVEVNTPGGGKSYEILKVKWA